MSKKSDKKLDLQLATIALQWSPFGPKWDSSAQNLENELKARGINIKLYHEYKLPDEMSPAEFMKRIAVLNFSGDFSFKRAADIWMTKNMTLRDKFAVHRMVSGRKVASSKKIREYAEQVKKLNPELCGLDIDSRKTNAFDVCAGAMFGFGPDEMKYFLTDYMGHTADQKLYDKIERYGIMPSYVLAPKTAKIIISALEKNKKNVIIKNNQGRKTI